VLCVVLRLFWLCIVLLWLHYIFCSWVQDFLACPPHRDAAQLGDLFRMLLCVCLLAGTNGIRVVRAIFLHVVCGSGAGFWGWGFGVCVVALSAALRLAYRAGKPACCCLCTVVLFHGCTSLHFVFCCWCNCRAMPNAVMLHPLGCPNQIPHLYCHRDVYRSFTLTISTLVYRYQCSAIDPRFRVSSTQHANAGRSMQLANCD
jgi:hypothetical protein